LRVPDAPAAAVATSAGATSVSIALTAPVSSGGAAVTLYSAVQSTGGAVFSSATSPITVTGLTTETPYIFQTWATNSYGVGPILLTNSVTPTGPGTKKAIFGYGDNGSIYLGLTNLVSSTGVVAADVSGVGTSRSRLAAATYGDDKAVFGYGNNGGASQLSMTNRVSNTGVVSADTTGVGTGRYALAATGYGLSGQAIFGYGYTSSESGLTNLVSNTGVVSSDVASAGGNRYSLAAVRYGTTGQAMFGYGQLTSGPAGLGPLLNLISNTGVVAASSNGAGTARYGPAAATYGTTGQALFGFGANSTGNAISVTNLVSNTGVVSADTTGVGTARVSLAASNYGSDKAIFGYGSGSSGSTAITNLVSNTGVVATDTAGVGTVRYQLAAAGFSSSP
jgi:hypothetical protein